MNLKYLSLIIALAALLSACGPKATPEPALSAADVQATAVSMAWTMAAQTQAAIPTATATPISTATFTPLPTATINLTPLASPTSYAFALPTSTTASGKDECDKILPANPTGKKATMYIVNENKAQTNLSLYLAKTPFGECGYTGVAISGKGTASLTLPQGCYSAYAWVNDPKKPSTAEGYGLCMNNPDKWTLIIRQNIIILKSP